MHYDIISSSFCGPGCLNDQLTVNELVTLIARETTLTADKIEGRLLAAINDMTENYEPKECK